MTDTSCAHKWKIVNVRNGYLVTEGCINTGARQSFFSLEDRPPIDSYTEGKHHWQYLGSSQAVKFDLECEKCHKIANLDKVVGLMLCTRCDPLCCAGIMADLLGEESKPWIYVALCSDSSHEEGKCIGASETNILTDFFHGRLKSKKKRIFFVPCCFISNIDRCKGEVIADTGLTDIY